MTNSVYSKEYQTVIRHLKEIRVELSLSQFDVAKKMNKPQSYISKIERGERRIDIAELQEIASIYGKNVKDFL